MGYIKVNVHSDNTMVGVYSDDYNELSALEVSHIDHDKKSVVETLIYECDIWDAEYTATYCDSHGVVTEPTAIDGEGLYKHGVAIDPIDGEIAVTLFSCEVNTDDVVEAMVDEYEDLVAYDIDVYTMDEYINAEISEGVGRKFLTFSCFCESKTEK